MEKTASEWFDMLIEPYCSQAKENSLLQQVDTEKTYSSLYLCLYVNFAWDLTEQGVEYWYEIAQTISKKETTYLKPTEPAQPQPLDFNKDFVNELIAYIEEVEQRIENEWGSFRNVSELIEKKEMPQVYYKLVQMRDLPPNPK